MFKKICIIGVGLMGGSIAKASRENGLCNEIVGVGRNRENLQLACDLGVIDKFTSDILEGASGADLVVVCTPVGSFNEVLKELKKTWDSECLYTDVGSTKASVVDSLSSVFTTIPQNFVPAHPIAGSEKNGVEASQLDLFKGKRVILTPVSDTQIAAQERCSAWWNAMGAKVSSMSVEHHDEVLAATSHLPHVLAFSLVELLKNKEDEKEIFKYAAGGFKDFTRIASSDPQMWADICLANKAPLLKLIDDYQSMNQKIARLIEKGDEQGLLSLFESARIARNNFMTK
ncbi:MAG: prephenate dehydrogenase [Cycloclasticus sp. symbiont of Poecilosclerida sp. M]|nr:MAG: prephenate dehydrogenase [Cycloclasticus sp. symbiont of Poecilosclerida sp. M]